MAKIGEMGVMVTQCKDCSKLNKAVDIMEKFEWSPLELNPFMAFDAANKECLLSEDQLMRIIQMVNPAQKVRKIRLVSQDEVRVATVKRYDTD